MDKEFKAAFEGLNKRLDTIDSRLDGMDKRFDGVDSRLDDMDKRFDGVDSRLDQHSKMLSDLIEIVTDQKRLGVDLTETLSVMDAKLDATATSVALAQFRAEHGGFQRALNQDLAKLTRRTDDLEARMAMLRS